MSHFPQVVPDTPLPHNRNNISGNRICTTIAQLSRMKILKLIYLLIGLNFNLTNQYKFLFCKSHAYLRGGYSSTPSCCVDWPESVANLPLLPIVDNCIYPKCRTRKFTSFLSARLLASVSTRIAVVSLYRFINLLPLRTAEVSFVCVKITHPNV